MLSVPAYRIFISSTSDDFELERKGAKEAIIRAGHIPIGMEFWPADSVTSLEVIQEELRHCDVYVGIVGSRYGSTLKHPETGEDISYTEYEYDCAKKLGKSTLMLLMEETDARKARNKILSGDPERCWDNKYFEFRNRAKKNQVSFFRSGKQAEGSINTSVSDALRNLVQNRGIRSPGLIPANQLMPFHLQRFLKVALDGLCKEERLSIRCDTEVHMKEELARFFWHYSFSEIVGSRYKRIFFESGSTLAFVAEALLDLIERNRGVAARQQEFAVFTNNVLVLLQFMYRSITPYYLRPTGRPDDKYGATYGELDSADGKNPGWDEPIPPRHVELVKKMSSYMKADPIHAWPESGHGDTQMLILAAASGVNCEDCHPLGPHVGSYRNKLFKRALIMTGAPIIFFVHAKKFFEPYEASRCYAVCGSDFDWLKQCSEAPIAFCIGAENVAEREKVLEKIAKFQAFKYVSPIRPRGDYKSSPFLVSNHAFKNAGVIESLDLI